MGDVPTKFAFGCFLCIGLHATQNCPNREEIVVACQAILGKKVEGNSCIGDDSGASQVCVNPIMLLNALTTFVDPPKQYGLLYFNTIINGVRVKAIMDNGASQTFVSERWH